MLGPSFGYFPSASDKTWLVVEESYLLHSVHTTF